jgi:uncharacterized protein YdeI (YjbR/CyaY-like superfamily)
MTAEINVSSRDEWRNWLAENYASKDAVWLVYFKKHTGTPSISYVDSVKEALCFGWIDGGMRSIDAERYKYRFTPRRAGSKWSPRNIKWALELIEAGKMTEVGLAAFNQRAEYDDENLKARRTEELALSPEIEAALRAHSTAWKHFNELAPSYRNRYIAWLENAKRPQTREKRLREVLESLSRNQKLGMK